AAGPPGAAGAPAALPPAHPPPGPERSRLVRADEVGDAPGQARAEREQEPRHSTGLVAAIASSWFAWYSTAASAVRAARESWWTATQWRSSARWAAVIPERVALSSIRRRPRWTWPR